MIGKLVVVLATISLFNELIVEATIIFPTAEQYNSNPCSRLKPETSWRNVNGTSYIVMGPGIGSRCTFTTFAGFVDFPSLNIFAYYFTYTYYEADDVNQTTIEELSPPFLGIQNPLKPGESILFRNDNGTYVYSHIFTVVGYVPNAGFNVAACTSTTTSTTGIAPFIYLFDPPPNDTVVNELLQQLASRNLTTDLTPRHHGIDCLNEPH